MADIAVEAAIQLLKPLITRFTTEVSLILNLSNDVKFIKDELCSISALLKSAEEGAIGDEGTKVWLKQVRTLAYDIEDVIEEYHLFQKRNKFEKVVDIASLRVRSMATTIKSIRQRVYDIGRARASYRLILSNNVIVEQGAYNSQTTTSTTSAYEQSELIGVEIPRREIIELLGLPGYNKRPSTVVVVGMRGLGKTTIVGCVFNNLVSQGCFSMRAWVSVSPSSSYLDILNSMVKQFSEADNESKKFFKRVNNRDHGTLQDQLRKYLKKKRYLIVFDDFQVGNLDLVTRVKDLLPPNNKDNKILVTTRYENVAQAWLDGSSHGIYRLKPLPSETAWMLFCKKTFQQRDEGKLEDLADEKKLEDLARGIVQKCEGLPPAILAMGSLLSTKLNDDLLEWQKVYDSLGFYLEKNPHLTGIYGILVRNYYDLPCHLKPCFLYFGIFPKGYLVDRMRLMRLWIAEGFITKGRENLTLEEVAEEYLNELISMSIIEVGYRDLTERPKTLRVHEFLHEVILSKLHELNFCQILSEKHRVVDEYPRRLSIHNLDDVGKSLGSITKGKSNIRCIFAFEQTRDMLAGR